jgi:hypothetical protein
MSKNSADQLKGNCSVVTDRKAQRRNQPLAGVWPVLHRRSAQWNALRYAHP